MWTLLRSPENCQSQAVLAMHSTHAEDGGKVLLKRNDVEMVACLINKNAKPKGYVEIDVDAENYYRIKDSE